MNKLLFNSVCFISVGIFTQVSILLNNSNNSYSIYNNSIRINFIRKSLPLMQRMNILCINILSAKHLRNNLFAMARSKSP